jgi:hypothetical protein
MFTGIKNKFASRNEKQSCLIIALLAREHREFHSMHENAVGERVT